MYIANEKMNDSIIFFIKTKPLKMKNLFVTLLLVICFSCSKDDDNNTTPSVCDVKGTYVGTATPSVGASSPLVYELRAENFAVGRVTVGGSAVTFGGYRGTCDSVIISTFYSGNSSYYLHKAAFNSSKTVISGTFKNLTTPSDFGTFTLTKQ